MARATSVDSTWVGELASDVSIGGATLTLASTSGTNWPSGSGIFGVQVGEDPDDDAELCQVTRSGSTLTLDSSTLTKAHTAGVSIYYLTTAADINAKATDSGVLHTTGAETAAGVKTFTDKIIAKGSAVSGFTYTPGLTFDSAYPKTGIYSAAGNIDLFVESGGSQLAGLQVQYTSAQFNVPFTVGAPVVELGTYWDGSASPYTATNDSATQPCLTVYTSLATGNVDITLPDPYSNPGLEFRVIDLDGNAAVNNIVIACADDFLLGTTVEGAASYTINTNGRSILLRAEFDASFSTANWKIISRN